MKILSTKYIHEDLQKQVKALGHEIKCQEFIGTHALPFEINDLHNSAGLIVFTSVNAVRSFLGTSMAIAAMKDKVIAAISGNTKKELEDRSFIVHLSANNASSLAEKIVEHNKDLHITSVVHPTGNLSLDILEDMLTSANIQYQRLVTYETTLEPLYVHPNQYDAVMFFSPSGIDSFLVNNELTDSKTYCCIGDTTGDYLVSRADGINVIRSSFPSAKKMIETILENKHSIHAGA